MKVYTIDEPIKRLLITRGVKLICYTCGGKLDIGDKIASSLANGRVKLRHYECAKEVGLVD